MTHILLVVSSPRGAASHSTKVARALVDQLQAAKPGATVTVRDLTADPPPHISEDYVAGIFQPTDARTEPQRAALVLSDVLIKELFAADVVVIASAMINFGIASTLKTWFDNLLRAGITFGYSEKGPKGLVTGKKAFLVEARGGIYTSGPMQPNDFQEPYVKTLLSFMGLTDIEVIRVEGIAYGPQATADAVAAALQKVTEIANRA